MKFNLFLTPFDFKTKRERYDNILNYNSDREKYSDEINDTEYDFDDSFDNILKKISVIKLNDVRDAYLKFKDDTIIHLTDVFENEKYLSNVLKSRNGDAKDFIERFVKNEPITKDYLLSNAINVTIITNDDTIDTFDKKFNSFINA